MPPPSKWNHHHSLPRHYTALYWHSRGHQISYTLRVYKISPDMIVKVHPFVEDAITESLNLSMIGSMTTIPVPKTLESAWDRLTLFSKLYIAWTLRSYVTQLRHLRRSVPGTLPGTACTGYLFTDSGAGPFASYDDFTAWFNHKLDVSQRMKKAPHDAPRFDNSWPLVFTHFDLCPRNILLGRDGKLYVLDWQEIWILP
ncbi:hypothetical protein BU15DRAFT_73994 [Melanogaster broomeanus]|nr:hypothetical protein BU15DRAFT_73994 [Melanogaster broomeanus]